MKWFQSLHRIAACYLMCAALTCFVLGMRTYFDMEEYKCAAFFGLLVLGGGAFVLALLLQGRKLLPRMCAPVYWGLLCVFSAILSQGMAADAENAVWGLNAYYMGSALFVAGMGLYLMLRAGGDRQMVHYGLWLFLGTGFVVNLLGILNLYGADPLQVTGDLMDFQKGVYFTTIGQMDFVALLLVMWLSVAAGGFLFSGKKIIGVDNLLRLLCCFAAFWGMMLVNSDSYLLGELAFLMGAISLKDFTTRTLQRFCLLGALFWCAAYGGVALTARWPTAQNLPFVSWAGTPLLALAGLMLSGAVFCLLARWHGSHTPKPLYRAGRILCAVALLGTLMAVLTFTFLLPDVELGSLTKYLRFNERWGTRRGGCWITLWRILKSEGPLILLLGNGSCATHTLIVQHPEVWADMSIDLGGFYAAHNEYLELLIGNGVLGLVAWLGFVGSSLREAMKRAGEERTALSLAVLAYLAVAVVNIRTCMVFPVLMALLGCMGAAAKEEQPTEREKRTVMLEMVVVLLVVVLTSGLWQGIGNAIVPF